MGTKRHIAHRVRRLINDLAPDGKVVDLFSGMGCVAASLANACPVITNDALSFTAVLARARFTTKRRALSPPQAAGRIRDAFKTRVADLSDEHRVRLREEQRALDAGRTALADYMAGAEHVANNDDVRRAAEMAAAAEGADRYQLATLYFAAGYFGLRQAINIDAVRYAIDSLTDIPDGDRDWMLAAWLSAASTVINAPGHTAQFLKPNTDAAAARIRRYWRRNFWSEYKNRLGSLQLVGDEAWRGSNRAEVSDALELLTGGRLGDASAVYADPPYTRDQYSRYYHVYETLARYDFPGAAGTGRARTDRTSTGFSLKTRVVSAFTELFDGVAELGIPLVLSYPSEGLLAQAGRACQGSRVPG